MENLEKNELDRVYCPIMKAMSEIGDKWILLLLRESFIGTHRFDDFQLNLGISKSVLSNKLKVMVEKDLLTKVQYKDPGERSRAEYHLTRKGKDLLKVVISLLNWGNKYLVRAQEPTMFIVDERDHKPVKLMVTNHDDQRIQLSKLRRMVGKRAENP